MCFTPSSKSLLNLFTPVVIFLPCHHASSLFPLGFCTLFKSLLIYRSCFSRLFNSSSHHEDERVPDRIVFLPITVWATAFITFFLASIILCPATCPFLFFPQYLLTLPRTFVHSSVSCEIPDPFPLLLNSLLFAWRLFYSPLFRSPVKYLLMSAHIS